NAEDIQCGAPHAPPVRAGEDKAPVPDEHGAAAEGEVVDGKGGDGSGSSGEEARRVGVGQVGAAHRCGQHLDVERDVLEAHVARVLDHDAHVGGVEVGDHVG